MRLFLFNFIHSAVGNDPIMQRQGYVLNEIFPVGENHIVNFAAGLQIHDQIPIIFCDSDGGIGGVEKIKADVLFAIAICRQVGFKINVQPLVAGVL